MLLWDVSWNRRNMYIYNLYVIPTIFTLDVIINIANAIVKLLDFLTKGTFIIINIIIVLHCFEHILLVITQWQLLFAMQKHLIRIKATCTWCFWNRNLLSSLLIAICIIRIYKIMITTTTTTTSSFLRIKFH